MTHFSSACAKVARTVLLVTYARLNIATNILASLVYYGMLAMDLSIAMMAHSDKKPSGVFRENSMKQATSKFTPWLPMIVSRKQQILLSSHAHRDLINLPTNYII